MHSLNNGCIYKVENLHFLLMQHVQIQCDRDIILCILKAKPTINHTGSPPRLWDHQSEHTSAASCQVRVPWREGGCNWMYFLVTNISYQRIIHWLKLTDITFQVNKSSLFHDHRQEDNIKHAGCLSSSLFHQCFRYPFTKPVLSKFLKK